MGRSRSTSLFCAELPVCWLLAVPSCRVSSRACGKAGLRCTSNGLAIWWITKEKFGVKVQVWRKSPVMK